MSITRVLVTGASGKVGRALVPALVAAGYKVRAVRFETPLAFDGVEEARGSVADAAFVKEAMRNVDAVCHLATCKESAETFLDVSIRGTFNLLEAARRSKRFKQFILASGDAVLGIFYYPQPVPLDENAPLAAYPGYYAFSKAMEEVMLDQVAIQYGVGVTNLRMSWIQDDDDVLAYMTLMPPNFGGPPWKDLATTAKQRAYFRKRKNAVGCLVHPNGRPFVRHLVGVADVVQAFLLALGNPAAIGETFNIAAAAPFSYDVLSEYIAMRLQVPVVRFTCDEFHDFSIDISKARSVLGYQPAVDYFEMVEQGIRFRDSGGQRRPVKYPG